MSNEEYASASESSDDDKTLAVSVKVEPSALLVLRRGSHGPHSEPLPLPPPELPPVMVVSSD